MHQKLFAFWRVVTAVAAVAILAASGHAVTRADQSPQATPESDTLTPPEALAIEGMPAVPARIAVAMAPYSQSRRATFRSWHPTSREMLVSTRFGDTDQIHRVTAPGGARRQLTFVAGGLGGGQRASYGATWQQKGGNYFVYQKDVGGNEAFQNYRFNLATGQTTLTTDGRSRNSLGVWSRVGDRLAYVSTRRNDKDWDLYVVDPADPRTDRLLAMLEGSWDAVDWLPGDAGVLALQTISVAESYLWRVDMPTGEKTLLTPKGARPV